MEEAHLDLLIEDVGSLFLGYFIQTSSQLYSKAKRQRFYPSFVSRFFGLSQMGTDLMATLGFMMPSTSYDRAIEEVLFEAEEEYR